jgi:peptide/nickel transport system permease protein
VHQPVLTTLPNTLQLSALAVLLSLLVGIPLGVLAARRRGTLVDQAVRVLGVAGHAVPGFWFALLFILVFAVQLRLLPVGGMLSLGGIAPPQQTAAH